MGTAFGLISGRALGWLANFCVIAVEAVIILFAMEQSIAAQIPFGALPDGPGQVKAASVDPALIEREIATPDSEGRVIYQQNQNHPAVRSLAALISQRLTDRDVYAIKVQYVTDAEVEKVANSDLTAAGEQLTPEQRLAVLVHLLAQERLTNEMIDGENAKTKGEFKQDRVFFDGGALLYIVSPYWAAGYMFVFFLIAVSVYAVVRWSFRDFVCQLGQSFLVGPVLVLALILSYMYDYTHSPGYSLIEPLFSSILLYTILAAAASFGLSFVLYLLVRGLRVFGKEFGMVLMALTGGSNLFLVLKHEDFTAMWPFVVLLLVGLVLWMLCLQPGDFAYPAVSRILRRRPVPAVFRPQPTSTAMGALMLVVLLLSVAAACALFYFYTNAIAPFAGYTQCATAAPFPTTSERERTTWLALSAILFLVTAAVAWVGAIVAAVTRRGRSPAIAGIIVGLCAVPAITGAVAFGMMSSC